LAALRGGIKTVFLPRENVKDLADMPKNIKEGLEIIPVDSVDEVLAKALVKSPFKGGGGKPTAKKDARNGKSKVRSNLPTRGGGAPMHAKTRL
jgi:predicted ATP-dependent protease